MKAVANTLLTNENARILKHTIYETQGSYFDRSKLKKTSPVVKNGLNRVLMVKMVKIGQN